MCLICSLFCLFLPFDYHVFSAPFSLSSSLPPPSNYVSLFLSASFRPTLNSAAKRAHFLITRRAMYQFFFALLHLFSTQITQKRWKSAVEYSFRPLSLSRSLYPAIFLWYFVQARFSSHRPSRISQKNTTFCLRRNVCFHLNVLGCLELCFRFFGIV